MMKKIETPWESYMAIEYMGFAWVVLKYRNSKGDFIPELLSAPIEDGLYNIGTSQDSWVNVEDLTDYTDKELEGLNNALAREYKVLVSSVGRVYYFKS